LKSVGHRSKSAPNAGFAAFSAQKPAKIGDSQGKPKKIVENPRFSIDFHHPEAAL
jgi:hypothetical protein